MYNTIRGLNINNEMLWYCEQLNTSYENTWIGTSRDNPGIIRFVSATHAIRYFLTWCPDTDCINAVIDDDYRITMPKQAPIGDILQPIFKELGLDEKT